MQQAADGVDSQQLEDAFQQAAADSDDQPLLEEAAVAETVPWPDADAKSRARYKLRFSSQLMLPLRTDLTIPSSKSEPGLLCDFEGKNETDYAEA